MILRSIFLIFIVIQVASSLIPSTGGTANNVSCSGCSDDLEGKWWIWLLLISLMLFSCIGSICFHRNKKYIIEKFHDCIAKCWPFGRHGNNNANHNSDQEIHPRRPRLQRQVPSVEIFTTYNTLNDSVNMHNIPFQEFTNEAYATRTGSPVLLIGREPPHYFETDPNHRDSPSDHLSPRALTPIRLVEEAPPAYKENIDSMVSLPREEQPPTYSSLCIRETSTLHR